MLGENGFSSKTGRLIIDFADASLSFTPMKNILPSPLKSQNYYDLEFLAPSV